MSRRSMSIAVFTTVMFVAGISNADVSRNVINAFKGQLIVTNGDLPEGKNDADTIKKIKAARLKEVTGETADDVTSWHFFYAAFLNRTGSKALKLEFITTDKDKRLAADKRLDGIDPKNSLLTSEISITEDEGLAKGKTYTLNLVNEKNQVVSSTSITMK